MRTLIGSPCSFAGTRRSEDRFGVILNEQWKLTSVQPPGKDVWPLGRRPLPWERPLGPRRDGTVQAGPVQ